MVKILFLSLIFSISDCVPLGTVVQFTDGRTGRIVRTHPTEVTVVTRRNGVCVREYWTYEQIRLLPKK